MAEKEDVLPLPDDFCNYLPWACSQLGVPASIEINKVLQNNNNDATTEKIKKVKSRIKLTQSTFNVASDEDKDSFRQSSQTIDKQIIKITAIYNNNNNLVEIKFERNRKIPRQVMKVIRLIIYSNLHLNKIHINGGIDKYTIHEINQITKVSNITEICLDNCFVSEGNYSILLENPLRYLSLSKCKLNDKVIEKICKNLEYPKGASKTLIVFDLSINMITDVGVKFLGDVLRSNRKLSYLNLADNRITDDGANHIFDTLTEFPLKDEESRAAKFRHIVYLKEKSVLIKQMIEEITSGELDKKLSKRKFRSASIASLKKDKPSKNSSLKSFEDSNASLQTPEAIYDKAVKLVEDNLGEFDDPFKRSNTVIKEGVAFCKGNNTILYINLAFNNLTYISVKKILNVLIYQKLLDRKPIGLLNVSIEGNYLPISCKEMQEIDEFIEMNNKLNSRKTSAVKKRSLPKTVSR